MRLTTLLALTSVTFFCFAMETMLDAQALPAPATAWALPQGLAVKDREPRTYKFVVDYTTADSKGEIIQRQRLSGDYTRGLPGGEVIWKNVTHATVQGDAPFGLGVKDDFMEGFRYRNHPGDSLAPDFFKNFPPTAVMEKNLVWDTGMIEVFGQNYFERLNLNEPYHAMSDQDVKMPGLGTFHNQDVVLRWIGRSRRNGQDCAVIQYQAYLNPLALSTGGMEMKGRSDYWGEIWVSLATKQIEYATLYEVVVADMKLPGQDAPQLINVFRAGTFETLGK